MRVHVGPFIRAYTKCVKKSKHSIFVQMKNVLTKTTFVLENFAISGDLMVYRYERDERIIGRITRACCRFFDEHVIPDVPPYSFSATLPSDGGATNDSTEVEDGVIAGPTNGLFEIYADLLERQKETDSEIKEVKANIEAWFECNAPDGVGKAVSNEGTVLTRSLVKGRTFIDVNTMRAVHPDYDWARFEKPCGYHVIRCKQQ